MTSTAAPAATLPGAAEATVAELAGMLARLGELTDAATADPTEGDRPADAARIDAIALTERVQAAAAATQAALSVRFGRSQVVAQQEALLAGRDPRKLERGIGDQLGLACRVSPFEGTRRLNVARVLQTELPATFALLREGLISAYVAGLVVTETRHLDPDRRRQVDAQLVAAGLADCAPRQAEALARKYACAADPKGYTERGRTARKDRRVSLRPAPDTMSLLTGFLPVEQGVACWKALRTHADSLKSTGDDRSRDQIMADTLIERLTGQARAADVSAEVGIVIPAAALVDPAASRSPSGPVAHPTTRPTTACTASPAAGPDAASAAGPSTGRATGPTLGSTAGCTAGVTGASTAGPAPRVAAGAVAEVVGYGPIPTPIAKDILASSQGERWWRRLFTASHGSVIGCDLERRRFDGTLATLIGYRDGGRCREAYCDAPLREVDHIVPARAGGPASFTNGRAVCTRSNLTREMPGWDVQLVHDGLGDHPHTVATTTPTGHTYTSRAGPAP